MGRGRGKGKKQSAIASRDDNGSGEDEKLPVRRRGRPLKATMKDELQVEDDVENIQGEDNESEETKSLVSNKGDNNQSGAENGRKRKRPSQINESADSLTEENGIGAKNNAIVLIKTVGYRQSGSRRKNKPRRAAEVGVECQ